MDTPAYGHDLEPMVRNNKPLPVIIQINTTIIDMEKLNNSADVNLPQNPNDILLVLPQGLKKKKCQKQIGKR